MNNNNEVEKPKPKQLLRPITTGADSAMNQSQFLAITCNSLKAREKSRVHGAIGFGFASHWLKNWRESFKPITKRSNRNHVITFDSHLKTALILGYIITQQQLSLDRKFLCMLKITVKAHENDSHYLKSFRWWIMADKKFNQRYICYKGGHCFLVC